METSLNVTNQDVVTQEVDRKEVLAKEIVKLKALLDANKSLYEAMEKMTLELRTLVGDDYVMVSIPTIEQTFIHNGEVKFIAPEQVLSVVDNFKTSNTVFRPAAVKRYETIVQTKEEFLKSIEKAAKAAAKKATK